MLLKHRKARCERLSTSTDYWSTTKSGGVCGLVISDSVVLDGYTQPGAHPNTNPPGMGKNAVLKIDLVGNTLDILSNNSTVRGLVIRSSTHSRPCISIGSISMGNGNGSNTRIEGNFIGTDITGTLALDNDCGSRS